MLKMRVSVFAVMVSTMLLVDQAQAFQLAIPHRHLNSAIGGPSHCNRHIQVLYSDSDGDSGSSSDSSSSSDSASSESSPASSSGSSDSSKSSDDSSPKSEVTVEATSKTDAKTSSKNTVVDAVVDTKEESKKEIAAPASVSKPVPEPVAAPAEPADVSSTPSPSTSTDSTSSSIQLASDGSFFDDLGSNIQKRWSIFQKSKSNGYDFKQSVASVVAGEYDEETTRSKVEAMIASDPCVMFTWEASPSCVKAIDAFKTVGADVKIIRLDDPWSEGNSMRAELGKIAGRSSVPSIFVKGKYIGGYDGGVSDEAPGMITLSFQGKLRPLLEDAGVL